MSDYLTTPNAILAVGVALLLGPPAGRMIRGWIAGVAAPPAGPSFEKRAAAELIDLKNELEKSGNAKASLICRDLIVAVLYSEKKP